MIRIGIILTGDYSWAGGVYYSLNIIRLLHEISATKKIRLVIIVNSGTPAELIKEIPAENTELAYLDKKPFLYRLYHKLLGDRFVADINALKLDILYPLIAYDAKHKKLNCKTFYWLYDFQHKFLPQLFSPEELKTRDITFKNIADYGKDIVFSSQDSKNHFEEFYPDSKATKHVYNFVSLIKNTDAVINNTSLPDLYFIVCNQFWPHKNHLVVLKALDSLLKSGVKTHVVFTGRHSDERNKLYVDELKKYMDEQLLAPHITLTGFISREEQVNLIKNAAAVIQPSFFEGWSTVVEDAKALNKFLIASDLPVNKEQVVKNVLFFDPKNHIQLAQCMQEVIDGRLTLLPQDYNENIERSKNELTDLFTI